VSARPPSGEQFEIALDEQSVVVTEVGGGLRTYTVGSWSVFEGYGVEAMASGGRGQVLMPWPNRLQDGKYSFDGRDYQLALSEVAHSNAIHGLVRWVAWTVREREAHRVVVAHVLHPQPGYPFSLDLELEYELSSRGLSVRTTATNVGGTACPFGSGAHPYLSVGTAVVDDAALRVPAGTALHADDRGIPAGTLEVAGTELDFRAERRIGLSKLDTCFTDFDRDESDVARIHLAADGGPRVSLWVDGSYPYVMVFTGDIAEVGRRGLAIEPMTCAPNAFRTGDGLVRLEPGTTWAGEWGIEPSLSIRRA
jgi:aldose 1-epimerase